MTCWLRRARARSPSSTCSSRPTPRVAVEALEDQLDKLDQSLVKLNILRKGAGGITENDITLAQASNAIVIGFNVVANPQAVALAEEAGVDVRTYRVIYQAVQDIENAAEGSARARDPRGRARPGRGPRDVPCAEARRRRRLHGARRGHPKERRRPAGARRHASSTRRRSRSLRRFKDDVREVAAGYECGIGLEGYQDIKEGDIIQAYRGPRGRSLSRADAQGVHRHRAVRALHPGERLAQGQASGAAEVTHSRAQQVQRLDRRGRSPGPVAARRARRDSASPSRSSHAARCCRRSRRPIGRAAIDGAEIVDRSVEVVSAEDFV